jgi:FlaA1/EpsC-like NDP-sugar epimerase
VFRDYSKIHKIIVSLFADIIYVNISYYAGYLLRFKGNIDPTAFASYLRLWPYITAAHLVILAIFKAYKDPKEYSKKEIFTKTLNASTIACLASISIVYTMRNIYGFMPSSVFIFAWLFNHVLLSGWRLFIRYETQKNTPQ